MGYGRLAGFGWASVAWLALLDLGACSGESDVSFRDASAGGALPDGSSDAASSGGTSAAGGSPSGGSGGTSNSGGVAGAGGSGGVAGAAGGGGVAGAAGAAGGVQDAGADVSLDADADAGEEPECISPADCPVPTVTCMQATCVAQSCGSEPSPAGTACDDAGICNGSGVCGVCLPGATQCKGNAVEQCQASGQWQSVSTCPYVCSNGACSGVCVPGDVDCAGNTPEQCNSFGQWQPGSACSGTAPECHDGACEPVTPPSCQSPATNCGPSANGYCCATGVVTGGTFARSYDGVSYTNSSYTASVSSYRLDAYEVTVGRFRKFVDAGKGLSTSPPAAGDGANPLIAGSGWQSSWSSKLDATSAQLRADLACNASYATWTDAPGSNETRPINCLSWYEAFAFCAWDGARLATEAEWNYAASAGSEQRVYPWSSPPGSTLIDWMHASYYVDGTNQCMGDGVVGCAITDLVPVGSKGAGRGTFGQYELSGNVFEWTLDAFSNPYAVNPCTDCAVLSGSTSRVIRGGSFFGNSASVLSSARSLAYPDQRYYSVGVRCARAQ